MRKKGNSDALDNTQDTVSAPCRETDLAMKSVQATWHSPIGELRLVAANDRCIGLYFPDHSPEPRYWNETCYRKPPATPEFDSPSSRRSTIIGTLTRQLDEYFRGQRIGFEIECHFAGTEFQNEVWRYLTTIPSGHTRTYRDVAEAIGRPRAVRAVGAAVARNPVSILVPCHRVIGSGGELTGFAGGIQRKRFLLDLERETV